MIKNLNELQAIFNKAVDGYMDILEVNETIKPLNKKKKVLRNSVDSTVMSLIYQDYEKPEDFETVLEGLDLTVNSTRIRKAWENTNNPDGVDEDEVQWKDVLFESSSELNSLVKKVAKN